MNQSTLRERQAANSPDSWFVLFAAFSPALALLIAVLPSVSAARRMSFATARPSPPRSPDTIDHMIAALPTSWPEIIVASLVCGAVMASIVVVSRRLFSRSI